MAHTNFPASDEQLVALRDHPPHLAQLACGHVERFVLSPVIGWGEWCSQCCDFCTVVDGVSP